MALTKNDYEELADIIATAYMLEEEIPSTAGYIEGRILAYCQQSGHNFNLKKFKDRITSIRNELNT